MNVGCWWGEAWLWRGDGLLGGRGVVVGCWGAMGLRLHDVFAVHVAFDVNQGLGGQSVMRVANVRAVVYKDPVLLVQYTIALHVRATMGARRLVRGDVPSSLMNIDSSNATLSRCSRVGHEGMCNDLLKVYTTTTMPAAIQCVPPPPPASPPPPPVPF